MPFYRYETVSLLDSQTVLQRVGGLVREAPGFLQSVKESLGKRPGNAPPFIGKIVGNTFLVYRDIRYRNSFLPQVKGLVEAKPGGTILKVTMYLHPAVATFMLLWLGGAGIATLVNFSSQHEFSAMAWLPMSMFLFGVVLTAGGFYPEAFKARRLLEHAISNPAIP